MSSTPRKRKTVKQQLLDGEHIQVNDEGCVSCSHCHTASSTLIYHLTQAKNCVQLKRDDLQRWWWFFSLRLARLILADTLANNSRIPSYFHSPSISEASKGMQGRVDRALTEWVLDERVSFSIVNSPGLQRVFRQLNPTYKIPHRKTIRKRVLFASCDLCDSFVPTCPDLPHTHCHCLLPSSRSTSILIGQVVARFEERQKIMKQYFSDHPEIHHCILSDVWKDRSGRHWLGTLLIVSWIVISPIMVAVLIVGISTQFATEDLQIFAPSLAVVELHERHTIQNWADPLGGLWGVDDRSYPFCNWQCFLCSWFQRNVGWCCGR